MKRLTLQISISVTHQCLFSLIYKTVIISVSEVDVMINIITSELPMIWKFVKSAIDLLAVWVLLYYGIMMFKTNMRTMQLFKGVIVVLLVKAITSVLGLVTLGTIVDAVITWGVLAIVVIFQPEIRVLLEKMGQTKNEVQHRLSDDERERAMDELVESITTMSKDKTGALITFERRQSLQDFINTGVKVSASIKAELLTTIFYEGTPLHDGATIIKNDMIVASACFYPPTNKEIPSQYGARHRAAIGISEITDSLTVVVSEETGNVSFAANGELTRINLNELRSKLIAELNWYDEGGEDHE
ncbi:diadenylate cyclase CdaA [Catenibacterium mitsuokai]|uniref:Diadenylate cyclase n=2 Tax=Catenibacterium TaxID=135858 RepID=A0AAW4MQG8_9FIRM|nr:diadenylate cyclase CdaA [Catenibacterium mitsuokai]MZT11722.1 TIGR00159 family protein [Catenibacterium sp. BIOML-A1]RYT50452.1 TIGR00159 family protein [Catenibacterium sp. co_0103]MBV3370357.1 diadenylate cyclase CdaA [Catenibacterium mitsuokai]MBV3375650.1 diadenylate cyclase CdaA [Catenibacterium mitsuokai]